MLGDCVRLVDYMFQAICSCDFMQSGCFRRSQQYFPKVCILVIRELEAVCMKALSHKQGPVWKRLLFHQSSKTAKHLRAAPQCAAFARHVAVQVSAGGVPRKGGHQCAFAALALGQVRQSAAGSWMHCIGPKLRKLGLFKSRHLWSSSTGCSAQDVQQKLKLEVCGCKLGTTRQ